MLDSYFSVRGDMRFIYVIFHLMAAEVRSLFQTLDLKCVPRRNLNPRDRIRFKSESSDIKELASACFLIPMKGDGRPQHTRSDLWT